MVSEKLGFVLQIILFIVPLVLAERRIGSLQKEVSSLALIKILSTFTIWKIVSAQFPSEMISWYWVDIETVEIGLGIVTLLRPNDGIQKYEIDGSLIGRTPIWTD